MGIIKEFPARNVGRNDNCNIQDNLTQWISNTAGSVISTFHRNIKILGKEFSKIYPWIFLLLLVVLLLTRVLPFLALIPYIKWTNCCRISSLLTSIFISHYISYCFLTWYFSTIARFHYHMDLRFNLHFAAVNLYRVVSNVAFNGYVKTGRISVFYNILQASEYHYRLCHFVPHIHGKTFIAGDKFLDFSVFVLVIYHLFLKYIL